eukprot:7362610-Ditylum_brightwellii.AAC.1
MSMKAYMMEMRGGKKQLRRYIELKWKEKSDFLVVSGIDDPRELVEAGTNIGGADRGQIHVREIIFQKIQGLVQYAAVMDELSLSRYNQMRKLCGAEVFNACTPRLMMNIDELVKDEVGSGGGYGIATTCLTRIH